MPAAPQRGQREVAGEPTSAVPHRPTLAMLAGGQPHRVASHAAGPTLGVPGSDLQVVLAQPGHELALALAGTRACPHHPLQPPPGRPLLVLASLPHLPAPSPISRQLPMFEGPAP